MIPMTGAAGPTRLAAIRRLAALGRDVRVPTRCEASAERCREAGAKGRGEADYAIEAFTGLRARYCEFGLPGGNGRVLAMILDGPPTDFRAFAERWVRENRLDA